MRTKILSLRNKRTGKSYYMVPRKPHGPKRRGTKFV